MRNLPLAARPTGFVCITASLVWSQGHLDLVGVPETTLLASASAVL